MKQLQVVERDRRHMDEIYEERNADNYQTLGISAAQDLAESMGYDDWSIVTGAIVYHDGYVLPDEVWVTKDRKAFTNGNEIFTRIVQVEVEVEEFTDTEKALLEGLVNSYELKSVRIGFELDGFKLDTESYRELAKTYQHFRHMIHQIRGLISGNKYLYRDTRSKQK